jgi:hypothetical protein
METKVLTKEELKELKELKTKFIELTNSIGEIEIHIMSLKNRKKTLSDEIEKLNEGETALAKRLQDKYGQGTISLETGEISLTN